MEGPPPIRGVRGIRKEIIFWPQRQRRKIKYFRFIHSRYRFKKKERKIENIYKSINLAADIGHLRMVSHTLLQPWYHQCSHLPKQGE